MEPIQNLPQNVGPNGTTNINNQPAAQFGQYPVTQGYGSPYAQGAMGHYPTTVMAWVPFNDRMICLPPETLKTMEVNLTNVVQRTQDNNMTVALSVLQSAVFTFLQFEKAFKSLPSKGDDYTQLHNLQKCITELEQANYPQKNLSTHPFSWLVTNEDPLITNTRELFEHCIKVIGEFAPLLGGQFVGRSAQVHTYEKIAQSYGWTGWQQQAEQIGVSNQVLGRLLEKFFAKDPSNAEVYKEIKCFQQSVAYMLKGFFENKYPEQNTIANIYTNAGFDYFDKLDTHSPLSGVISSQSSNNDDEPSSGSWLNWGS